MVLISLKPFVGRWLLRKVVMLLKVGVFEHLDESRSMLWHELKALYGKVHEVDVVGDDT